MLIPILVNGVVVGCIYALVAVGFTVIYNATETVNFAVGESLMLGAYIMLTFSKLWDWSYALSVLMTLCAAALFGYVVFDRVVSRPTARAPLISRVIALIGLSSIIKGVVRLTWGANSYQMRSPFSTRPVSIGPVPDDAGRDRRHRDHHVGGPAAVAVPAFHEVRHGHARNGTE